MDEVLQLLESRVRSSGEGVDGIDGAIEVFEACGDVVGEQNRYRRDFRVVPLCVAV